MAERARGLFGIADLVTAVRLPLAAAFPLVESWAFRLAFVAVAALSDLFDGILARRRGPSRAGVVLDPIADKAFMLAAFGTVVAGRVGGALHIGEIALLLLRDFAAIAAFVVTLGRGRPLALPARAAGKWVTVGQFATLGAILLEVSWVRAVAWPTIALSAYAVYDYARAAVEPGPATNR